MVYKTSKMPKFIQKTYKLDGQPWYESKNIISSLQIPVISHILTFILMFTQYTRYLCWANLIRSDLAPQE